MHFTKTLLAGIVALAAAAFASPMPEPEPELEPAPAPVLVPAGRVAQARLGRTRARFSISGGSGRRPAWLRDGPYSINEKVGLFHNRSGTGTCGYQGAGYAKRPLDGIEAVIEKACSTLLGGAASKRFEGGAKRVARERLPAAGSLVVDLQFHSAAPVDVSREECVSTLNRIQNFYGIGSSHQRFCQGGWGYVSDGSCKVEMLFYKAVLCLIQNDIPPTAHVEFHRTHSLALALTLAQNAPTIPICKVQKCRAWPSTTKQQCETRNMKHIMMKLHANGKQPSLSCRARRTSDAGASSSPVAIPYYVYTPVSEPAPVPVPLKVHVPVPAPVPELGPGPGFGPEPEFGPSFRLG